MDISINDTLINPDSLLMSEMDSKMSKSRDGSPSNYIKFKVSDRETMASLQLAASTIMTSRNELPSLITRPQVSIEDNSKELHQVFGSFIHLETDRNGHKPRIFDLSKKVI